jgi:hypothetical protein
VKRSQREILECRSGTAQVEEVVLVVTVAIGFAAAALPLGGQLLDYHLAIEWVLWLPIP